MRRLIPALLILAVGATLLTSAEPASAVSVVTGVNGTAVFSGPASYLWEHCEGLTGSGNPPDDPFLWETCARWAQFEGVKNFTIAVNLTCFGICFGKLVVGAPGGPSFSWDGAFFIGSVSSSGKVVRLNGASITIVPPQLWVIAFPRIVRTQNIDLTLDYATGTAATTWQQWDEGCGDGPTCTLFCWNWVPPTTCDRCRNPSMSGTLISGGIAVSGL